MEVPAVIDGQGIHPVKTGEIPYALASMMRIQGDITELLYQAWKEKSRKKLLQALLLDPTISSYTNAVHLIDEMFALQAEMLPEMEW